MSALQNYFRGNQTKGSNNKTPSRPSHLQQVNCPVCNKEVALKRINEHLDRKCKANNDEFVGCTSSKVIPFRTSHTIFPSSTGAKKEEGNLLKWRISFNPFSLSALNADEMKEPDDKCKRNGKEFLVHHETTNKNYRHNEHLLSETEKSHDTTTSLALHMSADAIALESNTEVLTTNDKKVALNAEADESNVSENNILFHTSVQSAIKKEVHRSIFEEHVSQSSETGEGSDGHEPYYLNNFKFIIDNILSSDHYTKLFNQEDMKMVNIFRNMKTESQQLYIRLFLRKNGWLKRDKLNYDKISPVLLPFISELIKNGFLITQDQLEDLTEILNCLSAGKLRCLARSLHLFKDRNGKKLASKEEFASAIQHHACKQTTMLSFAVRANPSCSMKVNILHSAKEYLGECVKLARNPRKLFNRFFNLFSSLCYPPTDDDNPNQALIYKILLINKGDLVYPLYPISKVPAIFQSREEVIRYSDAIMLEEEFSRFLQEKKVEEALSIYYLAKKEFQKIVNSTESGNHQVPTASFLRRFSAEWVYTRICGKSVEVLEKKAMYQEAVHILHSILNQKEFCVNSRGFYWERITIDTERYLKDSVKTLDSIKTALADPHVRTGKRLGLLSRATRICNAKKNKSLKDKLAEFQCEQLKDIKQVTISASIFLDTTSCQRAIFLSHEVSDKGEATDIRSFSNVEGYALMHYSSIGYPKGVHGEGSSYSFMFSLLFWDIIFMDVPDVFAGPYQICPLDFFTDHFYERRHSVIDERLTELKTASNQHLRKLAYDSWTEHEGQLCVGINWKIFNNVEELMDVISCLGCRAVSGICEVFCKDYKNRSSGLPDLLVWNPSNETCKAVEVKGPGDRLSYKQIIWLNILSSLGVDAEVCYVKGIGGKRKRFSTDLVDDS